jgi:hypothetical protein
MQIWQIELEVQTLCELREAHVQRMQLSSLFHAIASSRPVERLEITLTV